MEKEKFKMQRQYREQRIQQIQEARRPSKILLGFQKMIAEPDTSQEGTGEKESDRETKIDLPVNDKSGEEQNMLLQNINQNKNQILRDKLCNTRESDQIIKRSQGSLSDADTEGTFRSSYGFNENSHNFEQVTEDEESSDIESFLSSCSSVESDELDYSYQFDKKLFLRKGRGCVTVDTDTDDDDDRDSREKKRSFDIDELVTRDMLSDTDSYLTTSEEEESELEEPEEIYLHRT